MNRPSKHHSQPHHTELELATSIAREAGEIVLRYWSADQHVEIKSDGTPVTLADKEVNRHVIERIKKRFPADDIIGEEESTSGYGSGRKWFCDPIDGTAAFIVGVPTCTFSLALVVDGKPTVAVAFQPNQNLLFTAIRGQGALVNSRPLKVSSATIDNGIIALAPDYIRPTLVDLPFMQRLLALDKRLAIFDGAVFRSCMVASGRIAGFAHPRVKPYDIAAVHLIIEEAGGKVTRVDGKTLDYSREFEGAVLSNGAVHNDLLALFKP